MQRIGGVPRRLTAVVTALVLATGAAAGPTSAAPVPVGATASGAGPGSITTAVGPGRIALALKATGLSAPVFATGARDGTARLFIVEQGGRIRILQNGVIRSTPFLSIGSQVSKGGEQGLLGLAFHPSFKTNRKLYVDFTDVNGDTIIREYKASSTNPNVVATGSARTILKIDQPYDNHNGGMLAFGPDGYLYIGMGDGGSGGDPGNRAQRTDTLLGKILRIDINGTTSTKNYRVPSSNPYVGKAGYDAIWQRGVRNPWRFSFDRTTGDMWIGDVGQNEWEEIDRAKQTSSGAGRGVNWGWHILEGTHCYSPSTGCSSAGTVLPIAEHDHGNGRCAITGGYVYRGTAVAALRGFYVYADYCSGEMWTIQYLAGSPATPTLLADTSMVISSFGEGPGNELYVVDRGGGKVYLIVAG